VKPELKFVSALTASVGRVLSALTDMLNGVTSVLQVTEKLC
jgi:hypothetical protein